MDAPKIPVKLSELERHNEGFLLYPHDWTPDIARAIAVESDQDLGEEHWKNIEFIRDAFETTEVVPESRKLPRYMKSIWGKERATGRYLYQLFPSGYGQTACKITGMRKPLKLMLDV